MSVSVLIATYGEEHWRELAWSRAYPSAAVQTDDVACFHDPEGTIASVRNEMARTAKGDWLCFLDADDELQGDYLAVMQEAIERRPSTPENPVLYTPQTRQILRRRMRSARFYPEVDLLKANWLLIGTLLEKSLFERVGGFEDYHHGFEDWSLWYKCTRLGATVERVPRAIYIQHVNQYSKHREHWRDRDRQVAMHYQVQAELDAWVP
jgi:glycosyltransferase involved in cell wall biosynthesis